MQAGDPEWHQGTGWLRHILMAFREGRNPCAEVKGACSESCLSLESWAGASQRTGLSGDPYFWGRRADVKPGDHLDGDEDVPDFLSAAASVVVSDPISLTCLFSSLEGVLESPGEGAVLLWSLALRKGDPHMAITAPQYPLSSFGLLFWTDCTLQSEGLRIKWEISMSERNSSMVMSRAVNFWAGLLPSLHLSMMVSQLGRSLKII